MASEWDDLKREASELTQWEQDRGSPHHANMLVRADRLLRLIAQAERAERLEQAARLVLEEPYGCPFCDSGILRKHLNPDALHAPNCGFQMLRAALKGGE